MVMFTSAALVVEQLKWLQVSSELRRELGRRLLLVY